MKERIAQAIGIVAAAVMVVAVDAIMSLFGSMGNDCAFNSWTTDITSEHNRGQLGAILAVNGDYYGANEKGYVIRGGHIYRRSLRPTDDKRRKYFEDLAILWDGTLVPFEEKTTSMDDLRSMGAMQVFAFGPTLIKNGEIVVEAETEALCQEYVDFVVDTIQRKGHTV